MSSVVWPAGHQPADATIHVVNRGFSAAPPEAVWAWLVRPDRWHRYYRNAYRMRHLAGAWPRIEMGSRFSWITFGVPVTTEVTELVAAERLAWTGTGLGSRGHHGWVLTPSNGGTEILTAETQHGVAARLVAPILTAAMRRQHQRWVDNLALIAASGESP